MSQYIYWEQEYIEQWTNEIDSLINEVNKNPGCKVSYENPNVLMNALIFEVSDSMNETQKQIIQDFCNKKNIKFHQQRTFPSAGPKSIEITTFADQLNRSRNSFLQFMKKNCDKDVVLIFVILLVFICGVYEFTKL